MHNEGMDMECTCAGDCNCKGMMKHQWHLMKAVRMLTAVIVIIFVFWCGFEFGEIRSFAGHNHGYGMMRTGIATPMMQDPQGYAPSAAYEGATTVTPSSFNTVTK